MALRSIAKAFGSTEFIWATNLSLRPDMLGLMNGSARSEDDVIKLSDRMKKRADLRDVKLLFMREAAAKNNTEIAFAVSFVYVPTAVTGGNDESE